MKGIWWEERGQLGLDWYFPGFSSEGMHFSMKEARGRQACGQTKLATQKESKPQQSDPNSFEYPAALTDL